jgi:hypothetical protein
MFLPKTSFAFPVSAGIDYYLFLVSTPPAETVATLNSVETTPDGAETRIPVPQFVPILSGEPPLPTGDRARESVLGRIEYGVPIGGTRSYRTTFDIVVKDNIIGKFECTFVFDVNVKDQAFGPVAVFAKMTANGVDASEFESFASTERCQVAQFARFGPSMILSARRR